MFIPGKEYVYTDLFEKRHVAIYIQDSGEKGHTTYQFELQNGKKVWLLQKQISERFN